MTLHLHRQFVPWCFRCHLSRDEQERRAALPECREDCEDFACDGECVEEPPDE